MFQPAWRFFHPAHVDNDGASRQNSPVRRILPISILALAASGAAWSQAGPSYLEQKSRLAALHVTELVEDWLAATGIPGAVVAVVERDQILALEGFGVADIKGEVPVDPARTVFRVGELVRPMTAAAVLQLVERGLIGLDSDLSQRSDMGFLKTGGYGPLTPAQLLLHTAGLDHQTAVTRARTADSVEPLGAYLRRRMPPRVRPPDQISIPSSHGYALAGLLVEEVSGESFASYISNHIFRPLGMSNTTVEPGSLADESIATGYRGRESGLADVPPVYTQTIPASFLLTTASDMARWLLALVNYGSFDGNQVLSVAGVENLFVRRFTNHESLPGRTLAFKEGHQYSPAELYMAATGDGFSAVMVLLPHRRVGVFASVNGEIDLWGVVYEILDRFDSRVDRRIDPVTTHNSTTAHRFAGRWRDAVVSLASAEKLLSLIQQDRIMRLDASTIGWRSRSFVAIGPTSFQESGGETLLGFVEGSGPVQFAATEEQVFERLTWYEARPVQMALWTLFAAVFLAAGWPRLSLPHRHLLLEPDDAFSPRWPLSLARLAATIQFVFIVALAILVASGLRSGASPLLYQIPPIIFAVLSLPLVGAALTLVAIPGLGPVWRSARWTLGRRLRLTLLLVVLVVFLPFLWSWNLLGFNV